MNWYYGIFACLCSLSLLGGDARPLVFGERVILKSEVMKEDRTFFVHLPRDYEEGGRYPVLYLMDGERHLLHTAGTVAFLSDSNRMPPMIVVGVQHERRMTELGPPSEQVKRPGMGGGDVFLRFLEKELIPEIDKRYRTRSYRVLAGHSLGGLFAAYTFLERNDLFNAYVAVSPSLWYGDGETVERAASFFKGKASLKSGLFISLANERGDMRTHFDAMSTLLKGVKIEGFRYSSRLMEDEDHGSIPLRAHYWALKDAFSFWKPAQLLTGLDQCKAHYQMLSKEMGYEVAIPEWHVNRMGLNLLDEKKFDQALEVLKWNVAQFPGSANVYDSLAMVYEEQGLLDLARKHYEKAWKTAQKTEDRNTGLFKANLDRVIGKLEKPDDK